MMLSLWLKHSCTRHWLEATAGTEQLKQTCTMQLLVVYKVPRHHRILKVPKKFCANSKACRISRGEGILPF